MNRFTSAVILALIASATARSQSTDKVIYFDWVKKEPKSGKISEENPAQITMDKVSIDVVDVKDVTYVGRLAAIQRPAYVSAIKAEEAIDNAAAGAPRRAAIQAAIKAYQDAQGHVKGIPFAQRHFEYKIAALTGRLAVEDPAQRKTAIELLAKFKKDHAGGWQITRAATRLADLHSASEDYKAAVATLKEVQNVKALPEASRAAIARQLIEVLIKAKEYEEASAQIDKLLTGIKADSAEAFALKLLKFQVEGNLPGQLDKVVKQIDSLIAATRDRNQLAACYNTKGSLFLANGRPKEALYEFLYVDLIYNTNPEELAKACVELSKLFDKPSRAREYAEKAIKLRQ